MGKMIEDPEGYFRQFIPPRDEILLTLEEEAEREKIPIIGPVMGQLLTILVRAVKARKVLELGTATGYSAIYLARGFDSFDCRLISLEKDPGLAERARRNLKKAGIEKGVEIRAGEALRLMESLEDGFDLIFLDIDKEGYLSVLPECRRLLRAGGLLVTDNLAFTASQEFNQEIFSQSQWQTLHLLSFLPGHSPERDGWSMALRL
jgi:predicted O-methyltransferase YrrM